jgi:hypothetical protein
MNDYDFKVVAHMSVADRIERDTLTMRVAIKAVEPMGSADNSAHRFMYTQQ